MAKLGDYIIDIAAGPFGSNLKVNCFVPDGFPIIDGANLKGYKVTDNVTKFVTEEKARSLHRSIAKRNDVVATISGNVGQISYIPNDSKYEEYLVSQRQFKATFDTDKVFVPYLIYYFHSREGQHKILSFANQTGVPALAQPLKNFKNIDITLPDIQTQRSIASILKSLDDKIENNRKINENLEQQAQALFKSWFIDFEPFKDKPFVESELGMIPKGWKVLELQNVVTIKRGGSPRPIQNYLSDYGYRWLKISDATSCDSPFIYNIKEKIKESGLLKTIKLDKGSLVLSNSATPGIPKILGVDSCIHDGWLYFPHSELSKYYLYLLFKYKRNYLISQGNGSVFTNLKTDIVKTLKVTLPDNDILSYFNHIIESIFKIIESKSIQNDSLKSLRDTLLPKLMSGEIKV